MRVYPIQDMPDTNESNPSNLSDRMSKAFLGMMEIMDGNPVGQEIYAIEEYAEAAKEITKSLRGKGDKEKLVDELCDVMASTFLLLSKKGVTKHQIVQKMCEKYERAIERHDKNGEI